VAAGLVWLPSSQQTHGILAGATVIVAVGIADDLLDLSADVKLAGQVLAAVVPVAAGVRVETMTLPFLGHLDLGDASYPLTVLGIVALMNIVNFIDGVDGLAAGVCTIAAGTFAVIALSLDRNEAGVLAMLTAGAALGYLRHGFHPASIFLGDSGSNLLGYMLAAIAVQGALKTNAVVALVFPLVILAVPILDSSFVIAKRIKYGQPVYKADSWHFHHRFANIGFSQRRTVVYLYGWTLVLAMLALALRFVPYSDDHGSFDLGWSLVIAGFFLAAAAASVYLVLVLEILKLKRFRQFQIRRMHALRGEPPPAEREVDASVAHELETGEFEVIRPPDK
jgi:UDP-GlcNAc:undecaprenyl-phosphate GlcNAc-1-phosphate transferase